MKVKGKVKHQDNIDTANNIISFPARISRTQEIRNIFAKVLDLTEDEIRVDLDITHKYFIMG